MQKEEENKLEKDEINLTTIYFPQDQMKQEGILVGFNFVGFLFVITKVIPRESFQTLE